MTRIQLVWAQSRTGVIGNAGGLPWHIPEDLAHFKRLTTGRPVVMGRKTWDSLPARFRPLPGRTNIVVTRNRSWQSHGAVAVCGLTEALQHCAHADIAWVIGGAQIYAQALAIATLAVVTYVDGDYVGDAYAPQLGAMWKETGRQQPERPGTVPISWATYQRVP